MNGIIASIQNYTLITTQELAEFAIKNGACAIRTDNPIKISKPIIGLKKNNEKYYITTDKTDMINVSKWADYVAIDTRKGNQKLDWLYAHAHTSEINIIADIENIYDVENIIKLCNKIKMKLPVFFATTFSKCNTELIRDIKKITNIPVIAEGGYSKFEDIKKAKLNGAQAICVGGVLDVRNQTKKYYDIWSNIC